MSRREVKVMPMSAWTQLPPPADHCQVCAAKHDPESPHNPQSMHWQVARQIAEEPPPTWDDALAHVSDEMHELWRNGLAEHGVHVDPRPASPAGS